MLERSSVVIHPDGAVEARFTGGPAGWKVSFAAALGQKVGSGRLVGTACSSLRASLGAAHFCVEASSCGPLLLQARPA